jgi:hypothetical protein
MREIGMIDGDGEKTAAPLSGPQILSSPDRNSVNFSISYRNQFLIPARMTIGQKIRLSSVSFDCSESSPGFSTFINFQSAGKIFPII